MYHLNYQISKLSDVTVHINNFREIHWGMEDSGKDSWYALNDTHEYVHNAVMKPFMGGIKIHSFYFSGTV